MSFAESSGLAVLIKPTGLFNFFHDCYNSDPEIYVNGYNFKLDDLLRRNEKTTFYTHYHEETEINLISYSDLFSYGKHGGYNIEITNSDGKKIKLGELDREFLFIFAISTLSRYHVNAWSKILSGKDSDTIIKITEYLQTTQSIFPNMVLNELLNSNHIFVPIGFMGKDTVNSIFDEKLRPY